MAELSTTSPESPKRSRKTYNTKLCFFSNSLVGILNHTLTTSGSCCLISCVYTGLSRLIPKKRFYLLVFNWSFGCKAGRIFVDISPCFITNWVLCHPFLPTSVPTGPVCVCTLNWLMNSSLGWWALRGQTSIQQQEVDFKIQPELLWLDTSCVSSLCMTLQSLWYILCSEANFLNVKILIQSLSA